VLDSFTGNRKAISALFYLEGCPPQARDLEEAVLGALMLEKDALTAVIDILRPESFYLDAHQKIFVVHQKSIREITAGGYSHL
jgi:replicative DNA helicase